MIQLSSGNEAAHLNQTNADAPLDALLLPAAIRANISSGPVPSGATGGAITTRSSSHAYGRDCEMPPVCAGTSRLK